MLPLEARIILAACRLRDTPVEQLDTLLGSEVHWPGLVQLALSEKIVPMLSRALHPFADAIPAQTVATLRGLEAATRFRSIAFEAAAANVIRRFDAASIPVMLLKGAALGPTVYPSPGERPMGDLDVLLPRDRASDGWRILHAAGWLPESEGKEAFFGTHQHLPPLVHPGGNGVIVEVHRHLASPDLPFEPPEAELWAATAPIVVAGQTASVLEPEYQLLHLCIHFAWSHQMRRGFVRTVRDCKALLTTRPPDWTAFVELARTRRAASLCFWTLELARRIADVPVPEDTMRQLRRYGGVRGVDLVARFLLATAFPVAYAQLPSVAAGRALWVAAVRPGRHGIGRRRPWDTGVRLLIPPKPLRVRIALGIRRLPHWFRFARRLGPPPDRSSARGRRPTLGPGASSPPW